MRKQKSFLFFILLQTTLSIIPADGPKTNLIYRKDIFKHVTGMPENDFVEHLKAHGRCPRPLGLTEQLRQQITHSISPLEDLTKLSLSNSKGTLSIIKVDVVKHPELRNLVDIGALQAENPDSVFQIASRPNGLEGHQKRYLSEKEDFVAQDSGFQSIIGKFAVQGEEAQISCPILGIQKIYYEKDKVNFLNGLGLRIDSIGDIIGTRDKTLIDGKTAKELSEKIQSSCWTDVPVTTGYANVIYQSNNIRNTKQFNADARNKNADDSNILLDKSHTITHVNVTAIDLDEKRPTLKSLQAIFGKDSLAIINLAKAALRAAYFAPIYHAVIQEREKVFLTLPGCGSFKNKLEWVAEILEELCEKNIINNSGLDITLVALEANGNLENDSAWERIEKIATKTRGKRIYNGVMQKAVAVERKKGNAISSSAEKNKNAALLTPANQPNFWQRYKMILCLGGFATLLGGLAYFFTHQQAQS